MILEDTMLSHTISCLFDSILNFPIILRSVQCQDDLDPGDYGDVWVKNLSADSIMVSYENVAFHPNNGQVNVQVTLHALGSVSICFGSGDVVSNGIASGIEGGVNDELFPNGPPVAYPLPGFPFNSDGIAYEWPSNKCYCFDHETHEWEVSGYSHPSTEPSPSPSLIGSTVSPSVSPTSSPSTSYPSTSYPSTSAMPSTEGCASLAFSPIANTTGATLLNDITNTDDYTQTLDLGFLFYWLGGDNATDSVRVSSNGQININPHDSLSNCCWTDAIGSYNAPRIALAQVSAFRRFMLFTMF